MKDKKEKKIKVVKDKEGVVFVIVLNPKITKKDRNIEPVKYVKSIIEDKLKSNGVYPENNQVGFKGHIDSISYFVGGIITSYIDLQINDNNFDFYPES